MADIRTLLRIACASTILAAAFLHAQQQIPDPANLTGEHVAPQSPADTLPINHGAAALQQLLLKLRTRASMMLIVAHPDDEDGGFLTYESRGQGVRVAMLTLTRGEGGQNLMSADFDDALGLIRTQELLAADRYMGVDQFFGTEVDFGFSKTKEETLQKWTHDRVLYDAVRCVRLYRPLVIASVFVGGPTDGHGHHQVSGEIAQEVFVAAADPKVFPEMGLPPWAPLKVYARVPFSRVSGNSMFDYATGKSVPVLFHNYVTGKDSTEPPTATVQIHEGEKSNMLGMDGDTYVQFARRGLALQKTQIGQNVRLAPAGAFDIGYTLMGSRLASKKATEQSIYDGIDTTLPGIADLAPSMPATLRTFLGKMDQQFADAQRLFDPAKPELTAPPLREALRTLDGMIKELEDPSVDDLPTAEKFNLLHELRVKRVQLNDALVLANGLQLRASVKDMAQINKLVGITDSSTIMTSTEVTNQGPEAVRFLKFGVELVPSESRKQTELTLPTENLSLLPHKALQCQVPVNAADIPALTKPYFSRPNGEQPFYNVSDQSLRNAPATPAPFVAVATFEDHGVPLEVRAIVSDLKRLSEGSLVQAAVVEPPVSVSIAPTAGIVRLGEASFSLTTRTNSALTGSTALKAPAGWQVSTVLVQQMGPIKEDQFTIKPGSLKPGEMYKLTGIATYDHHDYTETFRRVGYPGVTYTNYYSPAIYKATAVDLKTAPNLKVAYLQGTGDDVPAYLPNLGVNPTLISAKDLTPDNLKQYDAVILGVRAYAAHPELAGKGSQPLLDYASNGGVVILQYMTARYGDGEAPYPIEVPGDSAHNVVVEAQPVSLLAPTAPLFNWPNKITSADFHNWVAEYGHGFAASWSPKYEPLLEVHDPDQDPQKGGLLVAPVGKGAYIYCALALYRQLPEGVPGAYRLFANLLSYAKNPERK